MARELPKRFNSSQFSSIVNQSLKSGSLASKNVQEALKSSNAVRRAMAKSSMTDREAKTAFQVLHEKGMLKSQRSDHKDVFRKAVRTGQAKGEFEHVETLHEKAVRERIEKRTEERKKQERREENLKAYEAEKSAEEAGGEITNADGVVKLQKHGVAAQADSARKNHGVSASSSAKGASSTSAQQSKKPDSSSGPAILPDMFT